MVPNGTCKIELVGCPQDIICTCLSPAPKSLIALLLGRHLQHSGIANHRNNVQSSSCSPQPRIPCARHPPQLSGGPLAVLGTAAKDRPGGKHRSEGSVSDPRPPHGVIQSSERPARRQAKRQHQHPRSHHRHRLSKLPRGAAALSVSVPSHTKMQPRSFRPRPQGYRRHSAAALNGAFASHFVILIERHHWPSNLDALVVDANPVRTPALPPCDRHHRSSPALAFC